MEHELLTLPEHMSSSPVFSGVRVAQSFFFCVVFCRSLFVLLSFFLLSIVLSADLRLLITPFGIFKLFLFAKNCVVIFVSGRFRFDRGAVVDP